MTYPNLRTGHAVCGTVSDGHVLVIRIPFGQALSLRTLRSRSPGVVRILRRYYGPVRLPMPSRATTPDSGPLWAADPLTYDSFIHYTSPVYAGTQENSHDS